MDLFYRCLGAVAKGHEKLSRESVNLIQINWLITILLTTPILLGMAFFYESTTTNLKPIIISPNQAAEFYQNKKRHVILEGVLDYTNALTEYTTRENRPSVRTITKAWAPILSGDGQSAIYIELEDEGIEYKPKHETKTIQGMIDKIPDKLREAVAMGRNHLRVDSRYVRFDTDYIVKEGEGPFHPAAAMGLILLSVIVFLLWIFPWFLRYVIFRRTQTSSALLASSTLLVPEKLPQDLLQATGPFLLDKKIKRNFIAMPALLHLENGRLLIASKIDASKRFMGVTTKKLEGIWTIEVPSGSILRIDTGYQYYGFKKWPALKAQFRSDTGSKKFVLGFADANGRDLMASMLLSWRSLTR